MMCIQIVIQPIIRITETYGSYNQTQQGLPRNISKFLPNEYCPKVYNTRTAQSMVGIVTIKKAQNTSPPYTCTVRMALNKLHPIIQKNLLQNQPYHLLYLFMFT